jgi:ubiquinone/menaquinone biosynthesis C-methylase UbiE
MAAPIKDVPSPIDLRTEVDARDWASTAMVKRPWRTEFFVRMAQEVAMVSATPLSILELGSGPGFLAQHLLSAFPSSTYSAVDFSGAMHELARERLGPLTARATFVKRDFRVTGWTDGLPRVDAVVTIQAVHELRHKRRAASFYRDVRPLVKPSGMLLVCDHFVGEGGMTNSELFMTPNEQEAAIRDGGFSTVQLLMLKGGLVLFGARGSN